MYNKPAFAGLLIHLFSVSMNEHAGIGLFFVNSLTQIKIVKIWFQCTRFVYFSIRPHTVLFDLKGSLATHDQEAYFFHIFRWRRGLVASGIEEIAAFH